MTKKEIGTFIRHKDGKLELSGSIDYCIEGYKHLEEYETIKNKPNKKDHISFSPKQLGFIEALNEEDKEIVKKVNEFKNETKDFPTPTQLLGKIFSDGAKKKKPVNYITRKIDSSKHPKTPLKKCLEFYGGDHKGKRIRFTEKFQNL